MSADVVVERATPDDLPAVLGLLEAHSLPLDGLREAFGDAVVARRDGEIVGVAAIEIYREGVLLRSVAVAPALQRNGVGRQVIEAVLHLARDRRAPHAYLLTTTAERYFPAFGFERIERQDVPASIQESIEFRSACPSSAIVMRKTL